MNTDMNSNTQFYNNSTGYNAPYDMSNPPTVPVIPLQRHRTWRACHTLLTVIGILLLIIGVVCIILANVTCVFQVIATPSYSERKQGYCCEKISCTSNTIYIGGLLIKQSQDCYYCNSSLYADKLVSGLGSGIAGLGAVLIIIACVLYRKS